MFTSQAFRDYFPPSPPSSQGCRSPFKRLTLQVFPWWLCNRLELLAQPPTVGSSLKSVVWLPLPWTRRRPLTTHGISHSTRTEILTHSTRISHIRNSVRPTFHLLRISHNWRLTPDGRGGRFNFPGQTCPDPSVTLIRRISVANDSDSPNSLARQILAIRRIHFRPQSKSKLRQY